MGLVAGQALFRLLSGDWPAVHLDQPWRLLALAGPLVGCGTGLGLGRTSGHGVCGLARLAPRSVAAVATFMAAAILTVFLTRHGLFL